MMEKSLLACSECAFKTPEYIGLVKHYRIDHGLSLNEACAAAERRKPMKTLADAVLEHDHAYGLFSRQADMEEAR